MGERLRARWVPRVRRGVVSCASCLLPRAFCSVPSALCVERHGATRPREGAKGRSQMLAARDRGAACASRCGVDARVLHRDAGSCAPRSGRRRCLTGSLHAVAPHRHSARRREPSRPVDRRQRRARSQQGSTPRRRRSTPSTRLGVERRSLRRDSLARCRG